MNPIDQVFGRLRSEGRKAFIPFLTAGDPDPAGTIRLARTVARRGASLLEIGFPYSDPIADGPVIQASYSRVLDRGLKVADVLDCSRQVADAPEFQGGKVPLIAMLAYSLVYRHGPAAFLDRARAAGFSGVIVPDLPLDEADELARLAAERDLKLILLVTPTTPPDRAVRIARLSTGFLYCVSVTGITGARDQLPAELLQQLAWLRRQTDLPLCVGFGISRPEHVKALREVADGVIVGSALVRLVERAASRPLDEVEKELGELAHALVAALNP
jgi:tryptophan synthase alpha chain